MKTTLSLNKKILSITLGGVLFSSLCALIILFYVFSSMEESKKNTLLTTTQQLENNIRDQFYERYGDVKAFSLRFMNSNQTKEENTNYLNQYTAMYGIYDLIVVTDLKGQLIAVNNKDVSGKAINSEQLYNTNFADSSWFKGVIQNNYLEDKEKGFEGVYYEDAHFNPLLEKVYGHKIYSTIFSTYIDNAQGEHIGIISTHANFIWIENLYTRLYAETAALGLHTLELSLLNNKNELIIDYDPFFTKNKNIEHDELVLNKLNVAEKDNELAKLINEKKKGIIESEHYKKGLAQLVAYNHVDGPKIVDKLNWGVLIREDKGEFYSQINKAKYTAICIFGFILLILSLISVLFARSISKRVDKISVSLSHDSKKLLETASDLSSSSQELSSATIQQASSLQETVAAVTEINSMLAKNSEMTDQSHLASQKNTQVVEEGKQAMEIMCDAISEIKKSNTEIALKVEDGNKKISDIVQMIHEIDNKTKVINEIVFQTKLLSFNASVEAARAGEHGKGFAVVADEVGNLAQMSGAAAKEISVLLEESTTKVKNIVSDIEQQVSLLMQNAIEKIHEGEKISEKCMESFEKIYENSNNINEFITEITNSSKEQAKGVQEINQAMHELDTVTQQNSLVAQRCSQSSANLVKQSKLIDGVASSLQTIITGKNDNQKNLFNEMLEENTRSHHNNSVKTNQGDEKFPSAHDPRFEDL